jgi:hypothetical protein
VLHAPFIFSKYRIRFKAIILPISPTSSSYRKRFIFAIGGCDARFFRRNADLGRDEGPSTKGIAEPAVLTNH